jgi:hypothetical protein
MQLGYRSEKALSSLALVAVFLDARKRALVISFCILLCMLLFCDNQVCQTGGLASGSRHLTCSYSTGDYAGDRSTAGHPSLDDPSRSWISCPYYLLHSIERGGYQAAARDKQPQSVTQMPTVSSLLHADLVLDYEHTSQSSLKIMLP